MAISGGNDPTAGALAAAMRQESKMAIYGADGSIKSELASGNS